MTPHDRPATAPDSDSVAGSARPDACPHLAGPAPADGRQVPVITLDPTGADHHHEAARLRAAGTVVRVILPGGIPAWTVTSHKLMLELLNDVRISKDWHRWTCVRRGDIGDDWPLVGMLKVTNMVTADGAEHQRLRRLVTRTLTPRRIQQLRPRITALITDVVDELPAHADADGVVDLRRHFAYPIPMR
ncbi:hypothetical protein ACWEVS_45880, partial [Nonomuraea sp. NPDC003754]